MAHLILFQCFDNEQARIVSSFEKKNHCKVALNFWHAVSALERYSSMIWAGVWPAALAKDAMKSTVNSKVFMVCEKRIMGRHACSTKMEHER